MNLRLPDGLLVSIGIEVTVGANAMIKREVTDTIPLLRVLQQSCIIEALIFKSKHLF